MCISSLFSWISGPHEGQWSRGSHGTARAELGSRGLCHHPARSTMPGTRVASGTSLRMRVGQGQARMWLCSEEWVSSPAMVLLGQGLMGWGDWHGTLGHKQVAETQGSVGTARPVGGLGTQVLDGQYFCHACFGKTFLPGTLLFWGHEMVQNSVLAALLDF